MSVSIEIMIDGVERDVEIKCSLWQGREPDVGIMAPYCEEFTVYHWSDLREINKKEYDSISPDDIERIYDAINTASDYY